MVKRIQKSDRFTTGFFVMDSPAEELFLSVTPGFERGPGIERDGITEPRMLDPHSVEAVCLRAQLTPATQCSTSDGYEQRAGTWTLYQHLKRFVDAHRGPGRRWRVIAVQSNGDLTMNLWHVAFIRRSHTRSHHNTLCYLSGDTLKEPLGGRVYRCLVKWDADTAKVRRRRYDFVDLRIVDVAGDKPLLKLVDNDDNARHQQWLAGCPRYEPRTRDIRALVELALAGKIIIESGSELSMPSAVDRFDDVRHVFSLPIVPARGSFGGVTVHNVNFGEYQLFRSINERRAALYAPVVVDLHMENCVSIDLDTLCATLKAEPLREVPTSPARPGEFRVYSRAPRNEKIEIFFPHSNYPFGALGLQETGDDERPEQKIVCLSASGLSGRVGNTLVGITRMMHHFFSCSDAIVLDEGLDVFSIVNPEGRFDNDQMLAKVLALTKEIVDEEQKRSNGHLKELPLNAALMDELERDYAASAPAGDSSIVLVRPQRSQVRSVLIFAAPEAPGE